MLQGLTNWMGFGPAIGGARPTATRSSQWPKVRKAFLTAHPLCAACGSKDGVVPHHIKPYHLFPELELDPTNLIGLCEGASVNCHLLVGHSMLWAAWNPYVVEDATRLALRRHHRRRGV